MNQQEAAEEQAIREDVAVLAGTIGERNIYCYPKLLEAEAYIERRFLDAGLQPRRQEYEAKGKTFANIETEIPGMKPDTIVVGAHYDTQRGSPGANDNASGVAALLALAREFVGKRLVRNLRLVAFSNEERPFLRTRFMGSRVYAGLCRDRKDRIMGMLSLENIGYCSEQPGSQRLSFFGRVLPRQANFLALVGNRASRDLLRKVTCGFIEHAELPVESKVLPGSFPGARSSDQWSFWKEDYKALMVTDTAPLRYPFYHKAGDTPDKIRWDFLLSVIQGLKGTLSELLGVRY